MKKVLSVLLTILLVISSFTGALVSTASAEAVNLWTSVAQKDVSAFDTSTNPIFSSFKNGKLELVNMGWRATAVKIPSLKANTDYELSFDCTLSGSGSFSNLLIAVVPSWVYSTAKSDPTQLDSYLYNNTFKLSHNISSSNLHGSCVKKFNTGSNTSYYLVFKNNSSYANITLNNLALYGPELFNVSVENGTASVSQASAGDTVTVSFNKSADKIFEKWEVVSNNVTLADATSATTTFTMPAESVSIKAVYAPNLWTSVTSGNVTSFDTNANPIFSGFKDGKLDLVNMGWRATAIKIPTLKSKTDYKLSFDFALSGSGSFSNVLIAVVPSWVYSTAKTDPTQLDSYLYNNTFKLSHNISSSNLQASCVKEFNTGSNTSYYLIIKNNSSYANITLNNLALLGPELFNISVENGTASVSQASAGDAVTVAFNDTADKIFEKWEVVSDNVTLADDTSATITFTMPAEPVEIKAVYKANYWYNVASSDISSYTSYGSLYSYKNKQLKLANMPWQTIAIKMPELEAGTTYELSMDYELTTTGGTSHAYFAMVLFTEAQYEASTSDILNSKYTKQILYNGSKILSGSCATEFTVGKDTTYYLAISDQSAYDVTLNNLVLTTVVKEDTGMNFEDTTKWERYAYNASNTNGPVSENWHTISTNTNAQYIKESDTSIRIYPESQINLIKLENLKPNTNYMLNFSYITDAMKSSTGTDKKVILKGCGIWNYAASNANFGFSNANSNGYLHITNYAGTFFDTFYDANGVATNDYYSRKITNQEAKTWYEKALYFNSGDVSETLSLVIITEVANVYFDSFDLVCFDDVKYAEREYSAPAVEGKTATGSYDSLNTTTTLYNEISDVDFENYKTTLIGSGFAEYATNAYGDNKFAIYTKGNTMVNLTYSPYNSTLLVAEQVTDTLPTLAEQNVYDDKGLQPLIIQLDHNGATGGGIGMSYAIRLADGSFIVFDGGHTEKMYDNADRIYNTLKAYTSEDIVIAAWLITHPHDDHIGAIISFIEKYSNVAEIEEIIFNFAGMEQYESLTNSVMGKMTYNSIYPFLFSIKSMLPETKISTCHSGYKYYVRNAVIDIMLTLEDNFPKQFTVNYSDANDTSVVSKVSFIDVEQTLLITGDSGVIQCANMLEKYSDNELESTFVQAIHHGISYGSYELYSKMNPEVVLWPGSSTRMMGELYQTQNRYFINEDSVKEIVLSDYGTRAFALPYTAPTGLTGMSKFTLPDDLSEMNNLNTFVGASIRQAGEGGASAKQALRFKFQIPEHIIRANTVDGYTVAEYGMMVSTKEDGLNYYAGNAAYTTLEDGTKLYKGVAYDKSTNKNVVYDYVNYKNLDDGVSRSVQYTCALYNIGVNGKATDYTKYDTNMYVRSYIAFKNANGDTKVYYGDTTSASVFAVMESILKSTATDDQTVSDKEYVKNFLDGKIAGFANDVSAIVEAWNAKPTRTALYAPTNN